MTILRESPWYNEILKEGLEEGREQDLEQGLERGLGQERIETILFLLRHKFGVMSNNLVLGIQQLSLDQLLYLRTVALESPSLDVIINYVNNPD